MKKITPHALPPGMAGVLPRETPVDLHGQDSQEGNCTRSENARPSLVEASAFIKSCMCGISHVHVSLRLCFSFGVECKKVASSGFVVVP